MVREKGWYIKSTRSNYSASRALLPQAIETQEVFNNRDTSKGTSAYTKNCDTVNGYLHLRPSFTYQHWETDLCHTTNQSIKLSA